MSTIETTSIRGITIDGRLRVPPSVSNLHTFREWVHADEFPENVQVSYIGGEIEVQVRPENLETHSKLKVQLVVRLGLLIDDRQLGDLHSDSTLLVCEEVDLGTEPDVVFCSWQAQQAGRVRASERVVGSGNFVEIVGAPDL